MPKPQSPNLALLASPTMGKEHVTSDDDTQEEIHKDTHTTGNLANNSVRRIGAKPAEEHERKEKKRRSVEQLMKHLQDLKEQYVRHVSAIHRKEGEQKRVHQRGIEVNRALDESYEALRYLVMGVRATILKLEKIVGRRKKSTWEQLTEWKKNVKRFKEADAPKDLMSEVSELIKKPLSEFTDLPMDNASVGLHVHISTVKPAYERRKSLTDSSHRYPLTAPAHQTPHTRSSIRLPQPGNFLQHSHHLSIHSFAHGTQPPGSSGATKDSAGAGAHTDEDVKALSQNGDSAANSVIGTVHTGNSILDGLSPVITAVRRPLLPPPQSHADSQQAVMHTDEQADDELNGQLHAPIHAPLKS